MTDVHADFGFADDEFGGEATDVLMLPLASERGQRARDLIEFAAGLDAGGMRDYARRARVTAQDLLEALQEIEAARTSIASLREDRDRWRDDRWREAHGEGWPK